MASEYTPKYNLDLYVSADKPNLRDQYNAAMYKIDDLVGDLQSQLDEHTDQINTINNQITEIQGDITNINNQITEINNNITVIEGNITSLENRVSTNETNITTNRTNITNLTNRLTTLENTVNINILPYVKRNAVLFQVDTGVGAINLKNLNQFSSASEIPSYTLDSSIPTWANYLHVQGTSNYDSFYVSTGSPTSFAGFSNMYTEQTIPIIRDSNRNGLFSYRVDNTNGNWFSGGENTHRFDIVIIPFFINGTTLTQYVQGRILYPFDNNNAGINDDAFYSMNKQTRTGTLEPIQPTGSALSANVLIRKIWVSE